MILRTGTKAWARKLVRSEAGASLVEFAILAPVLIFLLIGVIDVGRYTYDGILAANAARAGVQYGALSQKNWSDLTGMQTAALNDAQNLTGLTATPTHFCTLAGVVTTCPAQGASSTPPPTLVYYVEVDTSGPFYPLVQYPGIPSITVSGKAVMRVVNE